MSIAKIPNLRSGSFSPFRNRAVAGRLLFFLFGLSLQESWIQLKINLIIPIEFQSNRIYGTTNMTRKRNETFARGLLLA
jgi:hypothetical protein